MDITEDFSTIFFHRKMMRRCIELAQKGAGAVAPNPMVGAMLVYNGKIIGEGWHQRYGEAHAEVMCLRSVCPEHRPLLSAATLYVSLEPCAHFGKTPPCADLIIKYKIPHVVIGCMDDFPEVAGRGREKLIQAGVRVDTGILEAECKWLNRRFFTFHRLHRPYIILKWAQSAEGFFAPADGSRLMLSNQASQYRVHKMRSEEGAILVGFHTAKVDDPQLTNRYWSGGSPLRMVIDPDLHLPLSLHLLDGSQPTIVVNRLRQGKSGNIEYIKVSDSDWIKDLMNILFQKKVLSLIVEGGAHTLNHFMNAGCWDEAVIIYTPAAIDDGLHAPVIKQAKRTAVISVLNDRHEHYIHDRHSIHEDYL